MIPRPYQVEAVAAARKDMTERGSALLALPTGAGKTAIMGFIIAEEADADPGSRFLVLQHRDELLRQNRSAVEAITGLSSSIVKAESDNWSGQIVFGSAQTLARPNRREAMPPVSHIVIDEAHHAGAAGYLAIIDHARSLRRSVRLLGVTATPERADGRGLADLFREVSFYLPVSRLIEDGVLVQPKALTIDLADTELSKLDAAGGDFDMADADAILNRAAHNDAVVEHWQANAAGRRTIAFCTTIEHATAVAETFRAAGVVAAVISAETSARDRASLLARFDAGDITVLCNCMLLTEGYDSPPVSCVTILRPMLHRSTFIQAVGRGLRRVDPEQSPGVSKTDCVVLDFAGAAARHGSLEAMLGLQGFDKTSTSRAAIAPDEDDEGTPVNEARHFSMSAIDLLGRSPFSWKHLRAQGGIRIASGFDAFSAVIPSGDTWVAVGKSRGGHVRTLSVGGERQAISAADDYLRLNETSDAANKTRRWLREIATVRQVELLRGSGVDARSLSKYEASCTLNYQWNRAAISRAVQAAVR